MEDTDSGTQRARVLRVATRCTTSDQFVEAFARFCEGRTLFVSSLSTRPIGTRLPFVILLADGTRAMRGQCEVIESYANPGNIYRRPGVKLSLVELDDDSESMLTRLQEARAIRDARATGVHQAVSAAAVELPSQSRAAIAPKAATPSHGVGVLPALTRSMPPRPPGSKLPALPPLPRAQAHPPEPPPRAPSEPPPRAPSEPPPRAPAAEPAGGHWLAPQPPSILQPVHDRARRAPTHDPTDDGWGDDEARPPRAPTAPPVPRPRTEPPPPAIEEDSSPAMIVAAAPDHAAAAAAASTEPVDSLPVVELINRAHPRRDSGRVARPSPSPTPAPASGRTTGRHGSVSGTRPTPGDVYSPEERTPGSSFILPANPLSNLSDESLQGFIELTIYEDHTQPAPVASDPAISGSTLGMVDEEPEPDFRPYAPPPSEPVVMPVSLTQSARARSISMAASGELHVPAIDDRSPGGGVVVELVKPRVSQRLASVDEDEDEDEGLPPAVTPAPARHPTAPPLHVGHPTPAPVAGSERARRPTPPPPLPVAGSERARRPTPPPPLPAAPARARTLTPPPPLPPPPREVRPGTSRPDWMAPPATDPKARPVRKGTVRPPVAPPRRGWVLPVLLGGLVLVAAAALYVRYGDRLRKHGAATAPPHDAAVAALHVDAGVVAPAPIDAGATMVAAVDAGVDASTAVASGVCHLRVSTTPTGAAVAVGRRTLGDAPAAADFACGEVTVTARMAKYQTGTKTVTLAPGDNNVRIKLSRPMHAITVLSTPRGAVVTLDGRRVGTTPLSLDVTGFSRHALTIEYPAYQPYRTSVQTDEPEQTIAVPLVKQ